MTSSRPRVLYLVTEPWYFVNHRLDHARALLGAGFDVHVATRRGDRWDEAAAAGCTMHAIALQRGGGGAATLFREARAVRRMAKRVRPDVIHAVALKPVALALWIIALPRRPALVLSVNGLGVTAASGGAKVRAIGWVLRVASRFPRVHLLFQTETDRIVVFGGRPGGVVVPGVGVDVDHFRPGRRDPTPPLQVVYLGRAVFSKGLTDLAEAAAAMPDDGICVRAYCARDDDSPGALDPADWAELHATPNLEICEPTNEPEAVLSTAHVAVLPSRAGEGVSKFVLEALASGLPVVIAGESGSAEVIEPGMTGVVFRAADSTSLRDALLEIRSWSDEHMEASRARCRETAVERYSLDVILPQIVDLHRRAAEAGR